MSDLSILIAIAITGLLVDNWITNYCRSAVLIEKEKTRQIELSQNTPKQ
jgi:hypothetical protein